MLASPPRNEIRSTSVPGAALVRDAAGSPDRRARRWCRLAPARARSSGVGERFACAGVIATLAVVLIGCAVSSSVPSAAAPTDVPPAHPLIAGVPFISWADAARLEYMDSSILLNFA